MVDTGVRVGKAWGNMKANPKGGAGVTEDGSATIQHQVFKHSEKKKYRWKMLKLAEVRLRRK